jgi:formylglycine-generating enzyme required for sulfatase activity
LRNALKSHQEYIGAMTQDELREAITAPAEKNGWDFQPGLVDLILQDVGTEPGALPLLSHALLETWKRRQGRTLTLQGYHAAGGVKKAIAQTAESVYDKLSPAEQTVARNIFLRLTELGEGVQDTRRRVKLDELAQTTEQEAVKKVLQILTSARLVTTEEDSAEVAHEALIREWGTLRRWLDEDRESLRLHRHLTESALEWQRRGRESSELYRGTRLTQIQEWQKEHGSQLSSLEADFVEASQNVKTKERFRLVALGSMGVVLLLVTVLGITGQLNRFIFRPVDMEGYWVTIPAGEFQMGSEVGYPEEQPVHIVYLDTFELGRYEITNRQYIQCVKASICDGITDISAGRELHPVARVSWGDAKKFCEWVGGRLPTEAEWEKAARGTDERSYPWGDDPPTPGLLNYNSAVSGTTPVGNYPDGVSPYGLFDMAGNVWEWVNDWYSNTYYQISPTSNPLGPEIGQYRVLRGGSWLDNEYRVFLYHRARSSPEYADFNFGFRCAR